MPECCRVNDMALENRISSESAELLRQFFELANRTNHRHPLDERRRLKFLLNVHHEHNELPADLLESRFIEEQNWPEETADELITEYSFAMGLLDYSKEIEADEAVEDED